MIADMINNYFCTIGQSLSSSIPHTAASFKTYMHNPIKNSIFCSNIEENELLDEILKLNPKKSPGADNIGPFLVMHCATSFVPPLLIIFNLSLEKGIVPKELKLAKVTPIFKSGDPKVIYNYRPISLLSIFDKLLERLVCNRLTDFLNHNNILYNYQFGFRKKHSTSLALIDTIDKIYEYLDKKENVIGIYF